MYQSRNNSAAAFLAKNDLIGGSLPINAIPNFGRHGSDGTAGNSIQTAVHGHVRAPSPGAAGLFYSQPMQPHAPPVITSQIDSAVQELCKSLPIKPRELTNVVELIRNRDQQLSAVVLPPGQHPKYFGEYLSSMPRAHVQFVIEGTRVTGQVPWLLSQCVETLSTRLNVVGLFRVAGNQQRQKMLKEAIAKHGPTVVHSNLLSNSVDAIDIAAILKAFFSSIPGSVLTAELQEYFWQTLASSDLTNEAKSRCIALLTFLLPAVNRDTLLYYMQFLHDVGLDTNSNRMDHASLAICCTSVFILPQTVKQADLAYQQGVRQSLLQAFIQRPGILLLGSGVVRPSSSLSTSTAYSSSQLGRCSSLTPSAQTAAPSRFKFTAFVLGRKTPGGDLDGATHTLLDSQQNGLKSVDSTDAPSADEVPQAELFPSVKLGEQVFTFDSSPNISPRKHQHQQSIDRHRVEPKLMRSAGRMWTPGGVKRTTPSHLNNIRRRNSKSGSGLFSRFRTSPLVKRDSLKSSGSSRTSTKKPSIKLTAASATRVRNSCRVQQQNILTKNSRKASGSKSSLATNSTETSSSNSDLPSTVADDNISDDIELDVGPSDDAQQRLDFTAPTPTPTTMASSDLPVNSSFMRTPNPADAVNTMLATSFPDSISTNSLMPSSSTNTISSNQDEPQNSRYMGSLRHMVSLVKRRSQILFGGSKMNLNSDSSDPSSADYNNAPAPIKTFSTNTSSTTVVKETVLNHHSYHQAAASQPRLVRTTTSVDSNSRPKIISLTQHDGTLRSPTHRSVTHASSASRFNNIMSHAGYPFTAHANVVGASTTNNNADDDEDMSMSSID